LLFLNIVATNFAYLARLLAPLLLLPVLSHRLNATTYGVYMYAMAVAQWLSLLIEFGFNLSATRRISAAHDKGEIADVVCETQDARLTLALAAGVPVAVLLSWSPQFASAPQWAIVAWIYGALAAIVPQYYFQGVHRLRDVAVSEMAGAAVTLALVAGFVSESNQQFALPLFVLVPRFSTTMFLTWRMRRMLPKSGDPYSYSFSRACRSLSAGFELYTSFNLILAGYLFSAAEIGAYASADRVMRAGLGFFGQISAAVFPKFVAMRASGDITLHRMRLIALLIMALLGTLGAVIVWLAAPLLCKLLFGAVHELAQEILRIEVAVIPAIAISSVLSFHYFLVDGRDRSLTRVVMLAAAINVPLCIYLMKRDGVTGGATLWVIVEWSITIALLFLARQHQKISNSRKVHDF
jgi:PST family polysaccharide transporter